MINIFVKNSNKENHHLLLSACFLVFLAGPIGALQNIFGSNISYIVRIILISAGLCLSYIASLNNSNAKGYCVNNIVALISYIISISISMLLNPDSRIYALYQIFGLMVWILFGVLIAQALNEEVDRICSVIIGYLLANIVFVLLTCLYVVMNFHESFNPTNERLIGPFDGSTVVSEIFFASLIFGLILMFLDKYIFGVLTVSVSLLAIFLTGVRSAIVISCVVIMIFISIYVNSVNIKYKYRNILLSSAVIFLISISYFYFIGTATIERFRLNNILNEGRVQIWLFGMEIFERGSLLFGKGIRAEFITDLPMHEEYYKSAIAWHNTWLAIFIETGIIGLISYSIILFISLRRLWKSSILFGKLNKYQYMLIVSASLLFFRYVLMSLTEMNLYTALSPGVMLFCIIFGVFSVKET